MRGLQDIGENVTSVFRNRKSPYTQQYMLGFQYLITPNDSLDVAYVGNHGTFMPFGSLNRTQLNPSNLGLGPSDTTCRSWEEPGLVPSLPCSTVSAGNLRNFQQNRAHNISTIAGI